MKKNIAAFAPYLIALGIDFYLLPLLAKDTGSAMLLMLCVMPLIALATGVLYAVRRGFGLLPSLAALILFVPTIFMFYNSSAWVYSVAYAVLVLAGTGIGTIFYHKR
ncbi:MAG: hypothetical protein HDT27_07825 [Subdoligranulum sp.]|nr:hypothetical protein [Subdoligranulum sp.]